MATWSKEILENFIELYRSKECLWRIKSKQYSNRLEKEKAYADLVKLVQQINPSADKDLILKKINNLRNCFRKELKKVEKSKISGTASEEVYEPKLWYFHLLTFLKDQELPRQSLSNLEADEETITAEAKNFEDALSPGDDQEFEIKNDPAVYTDFDAQSPRSSHSGNTTPGFVFTSTPRAIPAVHSRRRKRETADEELPHLARSGLADPLTTPKEDEYDVYGKSIAFKMRKLEPEQRIHAEKIIADVFYAGQLGALNVNSAFVTIMSQPYYSTSASGTRSSHEIYRPYSSQLHVAGMPGFARV